jgi:hypothetical protein
MEMNAKLPYTVQCPALCESSQKYEELGFAFVLPTSSTGSLESDKQHFVHRRGQSHAETLKGRVWKIFLYIFFRNTVGNRFEFDKRGDLEDFLPL